jgi:hypothetical protein
MKLAVGKSVGSVDFTNCNAECLQCLYNSLKEKVVFSKSIRCKGKDVRIGNIKNNDTVILICSNDAADICSSHCFKQKFNAVFEVKEILAQKGKLLDSVFRKKEEELLYNLEQKDIENRSNINKVITRLTHNLVSLNSRSSQELFALVPQERLTGKIHDQLSVIENIVGNSISKASSVFLRLIKNCLAMDAEFIAASYMCVSQMTGESKKIDNLKRHPLRRVVMNVAHAFFLDFSDHKIKVDVSENKGSALFDYPTFRCSIFHIFDNATKYMMPSTSLKVEIIEDDRTMTLRFCMKSLPILQEEVIDICTEGYSGKIPVALGLSGHGHGLYIAKALLERNNASFKIIPDYTQKGRIRSSNGREYEDNCFEILLPK